MNIENIASFAYLFLLQGKRERKNLDTSILISNFDDVYKIMNRYISLCNGGVARNKCRATFTRSVSRTVARMHAFLAMGNRQGYGY